MMSWLCFTYNYWANYPLPIFHIFLAHIFQLTESVSQSFIWIEENMIRYSKVEKIRDNLSSWNRRQNDKFVRWRKKNVE